VLKGGGHEAQRGQRHREEDCDAGAARGLTQALPGSVWPQQRQRARKQRVDTERQGEQNGKTSQLRHRKGSGVYSFKNVGPQATVYKRANGGYLQLTPADWRSWPPGQWPGA